MPGGHERHVELKLRRNHLFATWRNLFGKSGSIGKGGIPNSSTALVKKYGTCDEVVGSGASGIVRIAHEAGLVARMVATTSYNATDVVQRELATNERLVVMKGIKGYILKSTSS